MLELMVRIRERDILFCKISTLKYDSARYIRFPCFCFCTLYSDPHGPKGQAPLCLVLFKLLPTSTTPPSPPSRCLGEVLARAEWYLIAANLVARFRFVAGEGSRLPGAGDAHEGLVYCPHDYLINALPRE